MYKKLRKAWVIWTFKKFVRNILRKHDWLKCLHNTLFLSNRKVVMSIWRVLCNSQSSIVNEVIATILSLFIYFSFLRKNFERTKKHQNAKQTIFALLEVFVHEKLLLFFFSICLFLFC